MKRGRSPKARLTEHIMAQMPEMNPEEYNRLWGRISEGLKTAEDQAGVAICPNNDQALWSRYVALPRPAKRAILAMMEELDKK